MKPRTYIVGYVVGTIYPHDGMEWLCQHDGELASLNVLDDFHQVWVYPTLEKAEKAAAEFKLRWDTKFEKDKWPMFVRPYTHTFFDKPLSTKGNYGFTQAKCFTRKEPDES